MRVALMQFYSSKPTPAYMNIAAVLREQGHEAWIATPDDDGQLVWHNGERVIDVLPAVVPPSGRMATLPLIGLLLWRLATLRYMWSVRRFLAAHQPDVVQVNPGGANWLTILPLMMPSKMRWVLDWRQVEQRARTGRFAGLKLKMADARRKFYSRYIYDVACFLHPAGARVVLGNQWQKWGEVVELAVDERFLREGNGRVPPQTPLNRPVQFVYIGTLSRIRKLERILESAEIMQRHSRNFEIVLIGPERSNGFYAEQIERLGVGDVVRIEPPVAYQDVPATIIGYDVALAYVPEEPADWKYHPTLKVLEYRALGLPIVATDFEPNRETVIHGENGLLSDNDPQKLAEAMLRFVEDERFFDHCEAQAFQMRQGRTWAEAVAQYETDVYGWKASALVVANA